MSLVLQQAARLGRCSVTNCSVRQRETLRKALLPARTTSFSSTKKTRWPSSLHDFVMGTPIVTRQLPYLGNVSIDFGTTMMNLGAITSLAGFMMTDVLLLRTLSIFGSMCGITYNMTRVPKQINACAWGAIFVSVNVVQIIRLYQSRRDIKFSVEEGELYYKNFASFGVDPRLFQELMRHAEWITLQKGDIIVPSGIPLHRVIFLTKGSAAALASDQSSLYTYTAADNGCLIGATAVVDPTILGRTYPNTIVASEPVRALSFDTNTLRAFLKQHDSTVEAAILHLMYVDLIGALRRNRSQTKSPSLDQLKVMLQSSGGQISPKERQLIADFIKDHNITRAQFVALLQSSGWTEMEWKHCEQQQGNNDGKDPPAIESK
jgi:CRP-like cAMP-binding protein